MEPIEIIIELKRAGISQTSIADKLNISQPAISHVITGRRPSPKIKRAIAKALKMPIRKLWPSNNNDKKPNHNRHSNRRQARM